MKKMNLYQLRSALEGLYNHYEEPAKGTFEHLDWESINHICKRDIRWFKQDMPQLSEYVDNMVYLIKVAKSAKIKLEFEVKAKASELGSLVIEVYANGEPLTVEQVNNIAENAKTEM